jgi:hypothetical protein
VQLFEDRDVTWDESDLERLLLSMDLGHSTRPTLRPADRFSRVRLLKQSLASCAHRRAAGITLQPAGGSQK